MTPTETLLYQVRLTSLPAPELEYRFAEPVPGQRRRQWRFDLAWPLRKLAVEIEGGTFGRSVECHRCGVKVVRRLKSGKLMQVREGGAHNTGKGMREDMEKYNAAAHAGWAVLRYTPEMVRSGEALSGIERQLTGEKQVALSLGG